MYDLESQYCNRNCIGCSASSLATAGLRFKIDTMCLTYFNRRIAAEANGTAEVAANESSVKTLDRCLGGELPLAYIAWLVYSLGLSSKVCLIYGPWYEVVDMLSVRMWFGTNMLRSAVSLTAVVFLLLVSTHNDAPPASERQVRVAMVTSKVSSRQ